jgi:uncharacterized protein
VGVMLLLRKLGAKVEEQVAGLLHDVSHLAFSHVADWVFAEGHKGNEDLQDNLMEHFVRNGEIAGLLARHRLQVDRILNEHHFPLLEKKIPDLCADRLDYSLREMAHELAAGTAERCVSGLTTHQGEIVFNDLEAARLFAKSFLDLQTNHWGGFEAVFRYHLFSEALKTALQAGLVQKEDFFKDETTVMAKIGNNPHPDIEAILKLLRNKDLSAQRKDSGKKVFKKFRFVDPKILIDGVPTRLSALDPDFAHLIEEHRRINQEGLIV